MATIQPHCPVDDVMRPWPETIRIFLEHGFLCVGCPVGAFHSVEDACREHSHDLASFMTCLEEAAVGQADADREMR